MAQGEYIIFLDGDDTIADGCLERLHERICTNPGADLYPCAIITNDEIKGKNEILHAMPLPADLETTVDGKTLRVNIESEYPFRHNVKYIVDADGKVDFDLKVRVPSFATIA